VHFTERLAPLLKLANSSSLPAGNNNPDDVQAGMILMDDNDEEIDGVEFASVV